MKAIVFSGGGGKACYQVGVLRHLIHDLGKEYDIVCGNSAGAINATLLAQEDSLSDGVRILERLWGSVTPSKVYQNWYSKLLGPLPALWKQSAYDSTPLHRFLESNMDLRRIASSKRKLSVGAVSTTSGLYKTWREYDEDIVRAVLASSAYPMAFLPVEIQGDVYFDGGISEYTPLYDAVMLGATEIDAIVLTGIHKPSVWDRPKSAIDFGRRALDLIMHQNDSWGVRKVDVMHKNVTTRILTPSRDLGSFMDFRPVTIQSNMAVGYEDAKLFFGGAR